MSYEQTSYDKKQTAARERQLDKVVLLVGHDTAVLQKLVIQLAQKGADVALLCWRMPLQTAHSIRESVESVGRHFLLLEEAKQKITTHRQLIEIITIELGPLDIFIDLSAQKKKPLPFGSGDRSGVNQPNWQLAQVVLEEMA